MAATLICIVAVFLIGFFGRKIIDAAEKAERQIKNQEKPK